MLPTPPHAVLCCATGELGSLERAPSRSTLAIGDRGAYEARASAQERSFIYSPRLGSQAPHAGSAGRRHASQASLVPPVAPLSAATRSSSQAGSSRSCLAPLPSPRPVGYPYGCCSPPPSPPPHSVCRASASPARHERLRSWPTHGNERHPAIEEAWCPRGDGWRVRASACLIDSSRDTSPRAARLAAPPSPPPSPPADVEQPGSPPACSFGAARDRRSSRGRRPCLT